MLSLSPQISPQVCACGIGHCTPEHGSPPAQQLGPVALQALVAWAFLGVHRRSSSALAPTGQAVPFSQCQEDPFPVQLCVIPVD